MKISFPARFEETRSFAVEESALTGAVETAFENLGWQYASVNAAEFQADVRINLWSFGEILKAKISGSDLTVESRCALPTQCLDWGKNKRNVLKFFDEITRIAKLAAASDFLGDRRQPQFDENGLSPVERLFSESSKEKAEEN